MRTDLDASAAARKAAGTATSASRPTGVRYRAPARLIGGQFQIESRGPVWILTALTFLCCTVIFPPMGWWPIAYVCLAPWLVAVCTTERPLWVYVSSYVLGISYFLFHVRWLAPVTAPGYAALCVVFGLSFPVAAWPLRHLFRRHGTSMAIALPIAWTAVEYVRSQTLVGFPWFLLAHTQYRVVPMIQISDLVGAYGVSFVVAMVNGWVTDLLVQPIMIWRKEQPERTTRLPIGSLATFVIVSLSLVYGALQQPGGGATESGGNGAGPVAAVIQHDFPMTVDARRNARTSPAVCQRAYMALVRQAAAEGPDLIVLPETAWPGYFNREFLGADAEYLEGISRIEAPSVSERAMETYRSWCRESVDELRALSQRTGVVVVTGAGAIEWKPTEIPPRVEKFNSAFMISPRAGTPMKQYDKIHLVLFGEFVPFRYGSLHAVYEWLNRITPWGASGAEYSLTFGRSFNTFEFSAKSQGGRRYRAGTPICYEDTVPYIARGFARRPVSSGEGKPLDLLLNISNDGWFDHSAELEQHLAASVFRAVENRVGVARAVNTGASAVIDPSGRIVERVSLSSEKRDRLGAAERVLAEIESQWRSGRGDRVAAGLIELRGALGHVGAEFEFMADRLMQLLPAASMAGEAGGEFFDQLTEDRETVRRWREQPWTAPGYGIARLRVDPRETIYTRWGDWFSTGCVVLTGLMILDWMMHRVRGLRPRPAAATITAACIAAAGMGLLSSGGCGGPGLREPTLDERQDMERRAVYFLQGATADSNPKHRMHAIEALQETAPREGLNPIRSCLRDSSPPVRFAVLMALGMLRDRVSLDAFKTAAESNEPSVRIAAIFALHRAGDTSRTSELASLLLNSPNATARANAALAIERLGEPKSLKLLRRARRDSIELVRLQVLEAMASLGDEKAVRELILYGHSGVGQKMTDALIALGTIRAEAARELFRYRLQEGPYDEVRLASARGLGRLGSAEGLSLALERLSYRAPSEAKDNVDPPAQQEARIRTLAASALEAIGAYRSLPRLFAVLEDPLEPMPARTAAARAILAISRAAPRPLREDAFDAAAGDRRTSREPQPWELTRPRPGSR